MNLEILLMYSIVSFFYIISPGPAIFLAISNGMTSDMKMVAISAFGNILGLFILSAVSISGLGTLLATSAKLFLIVKFIGASYLIYLGIKQFRNGKTSLIKEHSNLKIEERSQLSFFKGGFFLAVTNPKPILFFTALFPQFLNIKTAILPQFFIMTAIFMCFSFMSLFCYGYISKSAKSWFANQERMIWFHRITGGIFIVMGVGLLKLKNGHS